MRRNVRPHGGARRVAAIGSATVVAAALSAAAWGSTGGDRRLLRLGLEELMEVRVTSLAKKPQSLRESAAAVQVIDAEEIRRSGFTELPELLRLVPGVQVARINANQWAISARGFNGRFANKLLVLVDGRSVYSPIYSGVYWDTLDLPLEEIERIEVIRGPGGALWGANAVNGVINIITRHTRDTVGTLVSAGAGGAGADGTVRHGGRLGEHAHYRVYGRRSDRDPMVNADGSAADDGWAVNRGGFRVDLEPSGGERVMVQGGLYDGDKSQFSVVTPWPAGAGQTKVVDDLDRFDGGHLLARWRRPLAGGGEWSLQGYLDRERRDYLNHAHRVDTADLDFQYRLPRRGDHEITWGAGYRRVEDRLRDSFTVSFDPERRTTELWSGFLQDEVALGERWRLTVGTKLEENDFTGFEWQPSVRLLHLNEGGGSLWGAISRAVHTPSRADSDLRLNVASAAPPFLSQPVLVSILANDQLAAETVTACELGWRGEPSPGLAIDVAGFYQRYQRLVTVEPLPAALVADPAPYHLQLSNRFTNGMRGESYGLELSTRWQATPRWRLSAGYAWLRENMHLDPGSVDTVAEMAGEGSAPEQQLTLRSHLDLADRWEFDALLALVDRLDAVTAVSAAGRDAASMDGYARLDLRLGWRPRKGLELSLGGQNLLDDRHPEFSSLDVLPSEVPRSIFGKVTWRF
ncbi:TonB-dependent receptor plug domain-containing protein [Endothiovibrio diazotrophicus]